MGGEWSNASLGELLKFSNGKTSPERSDSSSIPVYGSNGVIGYANENNSPKDSIIIGRVGSYCGSVYHSSTECWVTDNAIKAIAINNNSPKFLFYLLGQLGLNQWREGSGQPLLNQTILKNIDVTIPCGDEQKSIAHILGTLDDKIELNRQMNATLEAMAQALFKSWFVDFDPVIDNALAAGNPIPEPLHNRAETRKVLGDKRKPFPEEIQKQFPSSFVFSEEMGWIPEGWEVGQFSQLCEKIQNGGTPKRDKPEYWNDGTIPWLTSGEVRQTIISKVENNITEIGLKCSSAKWLPVGATVVAMYGATAGQVAFVSSPLTTNQAVCGLIPKKPYLFFNYLALEQIVASLANQARGSAQQNISKGIIEETRTIVPPQEFGSLFSEQVGIYFDKWIRNLQTQDALESLRDTLLPKLLSGQLRMSDAKLQIAGKSSQ